jgi:hypothetical protein
MVFGALASLLQIELPITDYPQDSQFDLEEWCLVFCKFSPGICKPPPAAESLPTCLRNLGDIGMVVIGFGWKASRILSITDGQVVRLI